MKLVIVIAVLVSLAACVPLQQDLEQLQPVTLAADGDISCEPAREGARNTCRLQDTARLVEEVEPDAVLVLGDAQYPRGSLDDFLSGYDANWGRFKEITYPVPGNHEYRTPGAAGYFSYFRLPPLSERSWYGFDLEGWRIYALDFELRSGARLWARVTPARMVERPTGVGGGKVHSGILAPPALLLGTAR